MQPSLKAYGEFLHNQTLVRLGAINPPLESLAEYSTHRMGMDDYGGALLEGSDWAYPTRRSTGKSQMEKVSEEEKFSSQKMEAEILQNKEIQKDLSSATLPKAFFKSKAGRSHASFCHIMMLGLTMCAISLSVFSPNN